MRQIFSSVDISLYSIDQKQSKNAIYKSAQWMTEEATFVAQLTVVLNGDLLELTFFKKNQTKIFAKLCVEEYPTKSIKSVPNTDTLFVFKNDIEDDSDADNETITTPYYGVLFSDKDDAKDFVAILTVNLRKKRAVEQPLKTVTNKNQLATTSTASASNLQTKSHADRVALGVKFFEEYEKILCDNHHFQNTYKTFDEQLNKMIEDAKKTASEINNPLNDPNRVINKLRATTSKEQQIEKNKTASATVSNNGNNKKRSVCEISMISEDNGTNGSDVDGKQTKATNKSKKLRIANDNEDDDDDEQTEDGGNNTDDNGDDDGCVTKKPKTRAAKQMAKKKIKKTKVKSKKPSSTGSQNPNATITIQETPPRAEPVHKLKPSQVAAFQTPAQNPFKYDAIMKTNSKTVKAAGAGAATALIPPTPLTASKVKQAVNLFEQKCREAPPSQTPGKKIQQQLFKDLAKTVEKPQPQPRVLRAHTKANTAASASNNNNSNLHSVRSSIDKRKQRMSQQKPDMKRTSVKRVHAFIQDIKANTTASAESVQADVDCTQTSDITSSSAPIMHIGGGGSSHHNGQMNNRDLLTSTLVQQNYRLQSSAIKNPQQQQRKQSLARNMERTTPLKMMRTENEDRKRVELAAKDQAEKERLNELEKKKQELIDQQKKKREERMRQISEQQKKKKEEDEKRRQELEAKQREVEENKRRMMDEKRREEERKEAERQKMRENRFAEEKKKHDELLKQEQLANQQLSNKPPLTTATSKLFSSATTPLAHHNHYQSHFATTSTAAASAAAAAASNNILKIKQTNAQLLPNKQQPNSTFVLNTPAAATVQSKLQKPTQNLAQHVLNNSLANNIQSYACTPLIQSNKLRDIDNYDVSDLRSGDETDDDEEPSKPVPQWAKDPLLKRQATQQYWSSVKYNNLFKQSSNCEIKLEEIFRSRRKKFNERSSSAIWNSPPVWKTGFNVPAGEESFRKVFKN